jgi:hypothetical protein
MRFPQSPARLLLKEKQRREAAPVRVDLANVSKGKEMQEHTKREDPLNEELLEGVTGAGGIFSRPKPEKPLQGVLVRTPSGNFMKSPEGNLIVAIQRSISEPPLPVHSSSEQTTSPRRSTSSTNSSENAFHRAITDAI